MCDIDAAAPIRLPSNAARHHGAVSIMSIRSSSRGGSFRQDPAEIPVLVPHGNSAGARDFTVTRVTAPLSTRSESCMRSLQRRTQAQLALAPSISLRFETNRELTGQGSPLVLRHGLLHVLNQILLPRLTEDHSVHRQRPTECGQSG